MPPKKGADDKKPKLSKKEKKALQLAKQEELARQEAELEALRERVSELTVYKKAPSAVDFVLTTTESLTRNPWQLVQEPGFARTYLSQLLLVLKGDLRSRLRGSAVSNSAAPDGKSENTSVVQGSAPSETEQDVAGSEEPDSEVKAKLAKIREGIQEISSFASSQPVYFLTDPASLRLLVDILHAVSNDEWSFGFIIRLLLPTIQNPQLSQAVIDSELIGVVMHFIVSHMPALHTDGSDLKLAPPAVEGPWNGQMEHSYSDDTFRTVFDIVHCLSLLPSLRLTIKVDQERYLHMRGLASGTLIGLSPERQLYAQKALERFREDSEAELSLGRGRHAQTENDTNTDALPPPRVLRSNQAMLNYWKGHTHRLFCDGLEPRSESAAAASFSRSSKTANHLAHLVHMPAGFAEKEVMDTYINTRIMIRNKQAKARWAPL